MSGGDSDPLPEYYADAVVVAFRVPQDDVSLTDLQPRISSSGGSFDLAILTDGDLTHSILLPDVRVGEKAWVQFEFEEPETIQALTIVGGGSGGMFGFGADPDNRMLEASDNGRTFDKVIDIPSGGVGPSLGRLQHSSEGA